MSTPAWPPAPRPDRAVTARRRALLDADTASDLDTLRRGLDDADDRVHESALSLLHRRRALDDRDLEVATTHHSPRIRRRVAAIAATDERVDLGRLLDDPDAGVVEEACFAAGERAHRATASVGRLRAIAGQHEDALCREAAVAALGAIGDPAGLPAILTAVTDKATVRRRAVLALAPFDGPEVHAALVRALDDRDWQVRQAAEDLLGVAESGEDPDAATRVDIAATGGRADESVELSDERDASP